MTITVSEQTQSLIDSRMKELGITDIDELLFVAVTTFQPADVFHHDELDAETKAAIEEADLQEAVPWEPVRDALKQKYGLK